MKDFPYARPFEKPRVRITPLLWLGARIRCIAFILALFFLFPLSPAHAAPKSSPAPDIAKPKTAPADPFNLDQLKAKRSSVEAMEGLDESVKKAALGYLDRAIQSKAAADQIEQDTKALLDEVRSAPDRIKKLRAEAKRPLPSPDPSRLSTAMDLVMLEQKAHQEDLNLVVAKAALGKWEAELEEERNSPQHIRLESTKANQQATGNRRNTQASPPTGRASPGHGCSANVPAG